MAGTRYHGVDVRARDFLELHHCVRCVEDESSRERLLEMLQHPPQPYVVSFLNAHGANLAWKAPSLCQNFLNSDILLRDGIGMEISMTAFGCRRGLNMNGTDFIQQIAHSYVGRRTALFGTSSPWLERARAKLEAEGLVIVSCHDGFLPIEQYLRSAAETQPELIILAMGMPNQEYLAAQLRQQLSHSVLIVNGGAILDFLGGKVTRAPRLVRSARTEWMYRLALEPRRLAPRYVIGIPAFFYRVLLTKMMFRRASPGAQSSTTGVAIGKC